MVVVACNVKPHIMAPTGGRRQSRRDRENGRGSVIDVPVNQLRYPAIFEEDGRVYVLYSVAGERGIGLGEVHLTP